MAKRIFILRARAAPTQSQRLLAGVGGAIHAEILAHALMNAVYTAQAHRADVLLYLVLESTAEVPRTICFDSNLLGDLGGFHEAALLQRIAQALDVGAGLAKDQRSTAMPGVTVIAQGFEKTIQNVLPTSQVYLLERKGKAIAEQHFVGDACFVLSDHLPMPKNSLISLRRQGAQSLSLGPTMLFASQCIVLIHNALDMGR